MTDEEIIYIVTSRLNNVVKEANKEFGNEGKTVIYVGDYKVKDAIFDVHVAYRVSSDWAFPQGREG